MENKKRNWKTIELTDEELDILLMAATALQADACEAQEMILLEGFASSFRHNRCNFPCTWIPTTPASSVSLIGRAQHGPAFSRCTEQHDT